MNGSGIRPRFSLALDLRLEEAQARVISEVEQAAEACELKIHPGYVCLRIPESERHFWSPRLTVSFDQRGDGKTDLVGIYGPNAHAWSLFLFAYLILGSLALFSGILGFVQSSLNMPAWGLWVCSGMVGAVIALYIVARVGKKMGTAQSLRLHRIVESAVGRTVDVE